MTPVSSDRDSRAPREWGTFALGRPFFARPPEVVARELLGAFLVVRAAGLIHRVRLIETEAYGGRDDPASHAARGPTPRCAVMFGPAGHLYVYRSYGVHWCANVVTGVEGSASAVLLRAGELVGDDASEGSPPTVLRGPGLLTRAVGLTGAHSGVDCVDGVTGRVWFERPSRARRPAWRATPRVGISKETDREWRFVLNAPRDPRRRGAARRSR
ncbi:MAG: DNA-3-methyladenine glycosylase [Acidimicrobiales bacterium]